MLRIGRHLEDRRCICEIAVIQELCPNTPLSCAKGPDKSSVCPYGLSRTFPACGYALSFGRQAPDPVDDHEHQTEREEPRCCEKCEHEQPSFELRGLTVL